MSKKHGGPLKKNTAQRQDYRSFVSKSSYSPAGTVPSKNEMLVGSNEVYGNNKPDQIASEEKIRKTPLKYKVLDWIKANLLVAIITAVLIGIGSTVIAHKVEIAVLSQRLDTVEKQIENIQENTINKSYLSAELELVKSELSGGTNLSFNDLEWRIKEIEKQISELEKQD